MEATTVPRHPTLSELKAICRKGERDPFWISNIFWRPFSIYLSWILIRTGITANQVTFISALFAVASSLVLLVPSTTTYLASVVLMQAFFLLDHVDGEIGRYRAHVGLSAGGLSGHYFDLLVHYFQGPTLYYCLGAGLAMASGEWLWLILGIIGGVGSSGFPRFVAAMVVLSAAARSNDAAMRPLISRTAHFNSVYWKAEDRPSHFFVVPRTRSELIFLAKQFISFPGNLFTFAAAVLLDASGWVPVEHLFIKAFLGFYAAVLLANLIFVSWRYMVSLSQAPL